MFIHPAHSWRFAFLGAVSWLALLSPARTLAQPANPTVTDLGQVEVRSNRDNDTAQRREATASKIVIGREELDKQGDATIAEVLKRLPGVTIQGAPGRGGAIRMRGMGSGYTQILLDGERVPPGFSIDQLTPEQIERIEVLRAPTAETGARAIAGTINIVLREGRKGTPDDLKLTASTEHGQASTQANGVRQLQGDAINGTFTLSAMDNYHPEDSTTLTEFINGPDRVLRERDNTSLGHRRALHANARLQWKGEQGRSLVLTPFVVYSEYDSQGQAGVRNTVGPALSDQALTRSASRYAMGRLNGQWAQPLSDDDRLEVRFGLGQSNYDYRLDQTGASTPLLRNGFETQSFVDQSSNLTGKWTRALEAGHQIVSGLEFEQVRREEQGSAGFSEDAGTLQARTRRWALYSQDEFRINPQWSAYAGLRHENLLTQGTVDGALKRNESAVWTPLMHAVFKPDPEKKDQFRMSLTRSYKTPSLYQLVARYVPSLTQNSPTQPDRTGNPDLRPELATGIDLAFERYLEQGGLLSVNLFRRNIQDVIRYVTSLGCLDSPDLRCVSSPQNVGNAITQGVELEAKFRLDQALAGAWPIDVRSNVSFFHSRVLDVPGPDNRLDQQPSSTGNLGADYRWRGLPLTLGGNFNWNPAYDTRRTENQWSYQGAKRVLDVYGLWRFSPASALRLSVSNLTPMDYVTGTRFQQDTHLESASTTSRNWRLLQLRLEMRL